jgi:rhodanese-related sulfurtransferase
MLKLAFLFISILLLAGCQSIPIRGETVTVASGTYQNITAAELTSMLKDKDFLLVNVHIPMGSSISGTDLFIPYDKITVSENLLQLPAEKDSKIVLYCRSGRMSEIAAEELVNLGYTNVWNVSGGMLDWEKAGYPLE